MPVASSIFGKASAWDERKAAKAAGVAAPFRVTGLKLRC
jgi:hypothetical protein